MRVLDRKREKLNPSETTKHIKNLYTINDAKQFLKLNTSPQRKKLTTLISAKWILKNWAILLLGKNL